MLPVQDLKLSFTFFDVGYRDKIQSPGFVTALLQLEDKLGDTDIIIRNPTPEQIRAACSQPGFTGDCTGPFSIIADGRLRNIAMLQVKGIDFDASYSFDTRFGAFNLGLSGTRTLGYEQAVTERSSKVDLVDTLNNPLALKLRARVSWRYGAWTLSSAVNHTGAYKHPTNGPSRKIDAWTTVDIGAGYEFQDGGFLQGTAVQLNAVNLLDKEPPFVNVDIGYDTAAGSLLGRAVSVQFVKNWGRH